MMELEDIAIGHQVDLLRGLDLQFPETGLVSLVGRNGVGKSTLLRTMAGLTPARAGVVKIDGRDCSSMSSRGRARCIAFVPSRMVSSVEMTVAEAVAIGRMPYQGLFSRATKMDQEIVAGMMETMALTAFSDRSVMTLSDGERQRVGIARALVQDTGIILLDEPTSHLDVSARVEVLRSLKRISQDKLVIYSTHDITLAGQLSDRMMVMDGTSCSIGAPIDLLRSKVLDSLFALNNVHIRSPDFNVEVSND